MPKRKLYAIDPEQELINKEILKIRKGKKWKQLELLRELREEAQIEVNLFGTIFSRYRQIIEQASDHEVWEIATEDLNSALRASRLALQKRYSFNVQYAPPESFITMDLLLVNAPMNLTTYMRLRGDIQRKGILVPILATVEREIIDGNYRTKAALDLNFDTIPYTELNLFGLPEITKTRIILDIVLGNRLARKQLTNEQRKNLLRQWRMLQLQRATRGRPITRKTILSGEAVAINELDKKIIHAFGINTGEFENENI